MQKSIYILISVFVLSLVYAQAPFTSTTSTLTTTIPYSSGILISSSNIPNNPSTINGLTVSISPSQPLLVIYYNNAGYFAYALSNSTDGTNPTTNGNLFQEYPNIYENVLPNTTIYSQLPTLQQSQIDNVINQSQIEGLNTTQQNALINALQNQFATESNSYVYAGAVFYSPPTSQIVNLECYYIYSPSNCVGTPSGVLHFNNFTDYMSSLNSPYNASIIYYMQNPNWQTSIIAGGESILNSGVNSCLTFNTYAILLSGGVCGVASVSYSALNVLNNLVYGKPLSGTPIPIPQIALPTYAETTLSTPQAINYISALPTYSDNPVLSVEFNYENTPITGLNMEQSIYAFNNDVNGNIAQQQQAIFFGSSLINIFIIGIICYLMLKFNGGN
jgi:hypothetical protein